ncbi:MAG TPA: gliding motility-associated C-terminal domain-containing protein [Pedobacter sp.]|nr:gliding motility-associated C-terminal domain-containing protein [Pedobacter sp.]
MKNFYLFVIILLFTGFATNAVAQNISNEGTDFWTVFPTHDPSNGSLATMNVNVTSKGDSEVTVSCGSYSETKSIPANTVVTFEVSRPQSYIEYTEGNKILTNRAIHILVTPGMAKVVAYSHVFAAARSAATLILPKESLGQKYYSMNYTQDNSGNSQNFLVLTAIEDNTTLLLHKKDGTTQTILLAKAGDVYEYLSTSKEDFTGTFVEVDPTLSPCKRFAAFSGSTSIIIGPCTGSRDPLLQQLYTINSWGKSYGLVPFKDRRYIFRVMAQEDNTTVKMNGGLLSILNKGQFYEWGPMNDAALITSDKLISVAQYSLTQACSSVNGTNIIGDPEMVLLNPTEFNIKNITVFSSNRQAIVQKYINVFMKTAKIGSFRLNGTTPFTSWIPLLSAPTYSYAQIEVYDESLTLTADDGFNAIAYGFGQAESYAYSAGTSLASSQFLVLVNKYSKNENTTACVGQATDFKLTIPYLLTRITWKLGNGSPDFVDTNPVPVVTTNLDGNLYTYTSPVNKIFGTVGQTVVSAIAEIATSTNTCITGILELNFTVDVNALPSPDFSLSSTDVCLGSEVKPIDHSGAATKWRWQFDNGPFIEEKSPSHIFTTSGSHAIKLWVANESGCWSDQPKTLLLNIPPSKIFPKIDFKAQSFVCINANKLQLAARETQGLSGTFLYSGTGVNASGLFDPAKAGIGIHEITYTFTSSTGCVNFATQNIEVLALPIVTAPAMVFILPGGKRVIAATASGNNLRYKWSPSAGLNHDDILNPIASPTQDTEYSLTVSINGLCDVVVKVLVKVVDKLEPPNSFSPNGDGINDVWNVKSLDSYPDANIEVFNRSGQKVFVSKGYMVPFDGNYRNKPLPVGVYYYRINPNNGESIISGALTIIR